MTATVNGRPVPREKVAEIVADLAKGFRKPDDIARRHHVPVGLVVELRQAHGGNDLRALADSAEQLRRPARRAVPTKEAADVVAEVSGVRPPVAESDASNVVPKPETEVRPRPYDDGLTGDERRACRAWSGLPVSGKRVSRDARDAWIAAGRPTAAIAAIPKPSDLDELRDALAVEAEATAAESHCGCITAQDCHDPGCGYPDPHTHSFACDAECGCGGRGYAVCDPEAHPEHREWVCTCVEIRPGVVTAESRRACVRCTRPGEVPADDDVIDAEIVPEWDEWLDLFANCETLPAVEREWGMVRDAVEMLRDALAEHEHREGMVGHVVEMLAEYGVPDGGGSDGTASVVDLARRILDQIEAA